MVAAAGCKASTPSSFLQKLLAGCWGNGVPRCVMLPPSNRESYREVKTRAWRPRQTHVTHH